LIGVFDSGIGGLTLLNQLTESLPHEDFAYYADSKHVPYSYRSPEEILEFVEKASLFLRNKGAKAVVLACNTATNVAVEYLREKYQFPIIAIQPAVKVAADFSEDHKRILVAATPITLNAERYKKLISTYLKEKVSEFDTSDYHHMVLGCTHFTFYERLIESLFSNLTVVDGNAGTAKQAHTILKKEGLLRESGSGYIHFYESAEEVKDISKYIRLLVKLRA
jgi:glutamate racemase